ncbi:uncharacterized protein LOC121782256 isoform X2 [Salvia splendens]|uniref:uncharacterized protein LOC121782256 isoform X2 n=1 Tax=Salvia splendens TaxID=180675 RepID=UPI001C251CF5|nr:uncharacterized protein LOC121782256 isoform X2 [Salvia splendens]
MPTAAVTASLPPPKRLLFDRRYGWILDEWKEPSVEALSGGRGMFCVIPLAKALIQKASETDPLFSWLHFTFKSRHISAKATALCLRRNSEIVYAAGSPWP